jgi:hypothetical protein
MTGVNLKFFRYIWAVEKNKKGFLMRTKNKNDERSGLTP